jgi:hypothetical protein
MSAMTYGDESDYLAEDYARLAEPALSQAKATLHQPTARVLTKAAARYLEKAKALGWQPAREHKHRGG